MKHKWLIVSILILVEIALFAGIVYLIRIDMEVIITNDMRMRTFNFDRASTKAEQKWEFVVEDGTNLVLESRSGQLDIYTGDGDQIVGKAHKTVWDLTHGRDNTARS